MRCVDVTVLVDAHRQDSPHHEPVSRWLDEARTAAEPLGVPRLVASGFLRVATHPRVFARPSTPAEALAFLEVLFDSPAVVPLEPGERHWELFVDLCASLGCRGNDIPDAYLVSFALERGSTWVSSDRALQRFPGLRLVDPRT